MITGIKALARPDKKNRFVPIVKITLKCDPDEMDKILLKNRESLKPNMNQDTTLWMLQDSLLAWVAGKHNGDWHTKRERNKLILKLTLQEIKGINDGDIHDQFQVLDAQAKKIGEDLAKESPSLNETLQDNFTITFTKQSRLGWGEIKKIDNFIFKIRKKHNKEYSYNKLASDLRDYWWTIVKHKREFKVAHYKRNERDATRSTFLLFTKNMNSFVDKFELDKEISDPENKVAKEHLGEAIQYFKQFVDMGYREIKEDRKITEKEEREQREQRKAKRLKKMKQESRSLGY